MEEAKAYDLLLTQMNSARPMLPSASDVNGHRS
jgi:hypothetical protein